MFYFTEEYSSQTTDPIYPISFLISLSELFSKFHRQIEKIGINFTNDLHNILEIQSPPVESHMSAFNRLLLIEK